MKLLVLKINSLLLLLVGLILGAHAFEIPQVELYWDKFVTYYGQHTFTVLALSAAVMVVFGLYAFVPRFPNRSERRAIRFEGEHGEVVIQLDSVQKLLTRIMNNMPEIRKVDVAVKPDKARARALIDADVVLENQADARARQTANVVTSYIAETAIKMLGLEDLATVNLNIKDIHLDPKAASEAIRASRASYEVGIPVGEMTHVEVSEEVPATVNEALDQEDEEPARDQAGYGLEDAGAMMAALDAQQEPTSTGMVEEPAAADEVLKVAPDDEDVVDTAEGEDHSEPLVAAEVPSQEEDDSEPVTPEPLITVEEEGSGPEEMPTVEEASEVEEEPVIAPLEEEEQVSETSLPPLGEVALGETEEDTTTESFVAEPVEEAPAEEEAEPTTWSIAEEPAPAVEENEPTTEDQADQEKKKEDGGWGFV